MSISSKERPTAEGKNKLTGWPRPKPAFGASIGLNPVRMAALAVLAVAGLSAGYLVGKYVTPSEESASTAPRQQVAEAPKAAPEGLPKDYEESLPKDIVIEQNGALQRIALPEPHIEMDLGSHIQRDASPKMPEQRESASVNAAAPSIEPADSVTETPEKESAEAAPQPSEKPAMPPVLVAALPDDIADLQRRDGDKLPAWQRFAVPVHRDNRPKIVVVIDDLGLDRKRSKATVALPGPLTMSYMAYAENLKPQTTAAKRAGHELMLHVPMEPSSPTINPGPNVLISGMPADELRKNVEWNLNQLSGYVGINNHMGSRFTADSDGMKIVVQALKERGLLFLDSLTSGRSVAHDEARKAGIPFAIRNIFLDHEDNLDFINRQLERTEQVARRTGLAIAIGHPRDNTLTALRAWLPELNALGFQLVPISAVARVAVNPAG